MGNIRRTLGGFALAALVAAGVVLVPASLHASGTSTGSACESLIAYRDFLNATYSDPLRTILVASVELSIKIACQ